MFWGLRFLIFRDEFIQVLSTYLLSYLGTMKEYFFFVFSFTYLIYTTLTKQTMTDTVEG